MEEKNKLYMNGQEIKLKNPGTKGLPDFLKIARDMSKIPKDAKEEDTMSYFTNEAIESMTKLIDLTLEKTFPDMNEEERSQWGMENAMTIFPIIIEMCSPKKPIQDQKKKEEIITKIKEQSK